MREDSYTSYTSTFSNKKLAILNSVLILFYMLYLLGFIAFCVDFFINIYSTEFNSIIEKIGFFLFICSITCICPVTVSLCRVLFNTLKGDGLFIRLLFLIIVGKLTDFSWA